MARIRSIHPGLFTDPEFATLSDAAQIFYLGLLTEADDGGVFEWNPAKLRIRLRPGKDGGTEGLLLELEAADKVRSYEIDRRQYGAIRKFTQWQRPKSPKLIHPIPDHFRNYVGSTGAISEIEAVERPSFPPKGEILSDQPTSFPRDGETQSVQFDAFPPKGEIPPQREEEGDKRKDSEEANASSGAPRPPDFAAVLFGACRQWLVETTGKNDSACRTLLGKWRKSLSDGDLVELLKNAQEQGHIEDPVSWIERAIQVRKGPPRRQHGADFN